MIIRIRTALALLAATAAPAAAAAADRIDRGDGSFFNRPGATAAEATAATADCKAIADGAESQINGAAVVMGGLGGLLGGVFAGNRLKRVNIENCMLIRGWRLYAMTRKEGAAWKALSPAKREAELATLVGAETPARGGLLRVWHNDYAEPALWPKP